VQLHELDTAAVATDVRMSGMSAIELVTRIRASVPELNVIVITAPRFRIWHGHRNRARVADRG
jgi:DNA-binding NtrC family response regulator